MPKETKSAIKWALQQEYVLDLGGEIYYIPVTVDDYLSFMVREYFNNHDIDYSTYSHSDLIPFLQEMGLLH